MLFFGLLSVNTIVAGNPDGDLEIQLLSGSNLIIAPNGTGPELIYIGAKITNNGQDALTDISISIGDFDKNTPGIYPSREHTGLSGKLALSHQNAGGNYSDANRYVADLAPGKSLVQYWLVEYPRTDQNGTSVSLTDLTEDDLWLEYDVWATAKDASANLAANTSQILNFRSQTINTKSQAWGMDRAELPTEYADLLASIDGWDTNNQNVALAGQSIVIPVWHQLGTVKNGFDSNTDLVPDFNAFLQPVGKLANFEPSCFRLIRTYGVLLVEDQDGNITFTSFNNQTHFTNISRENKTVMGLVNYEMMALGSECTASLSPFQSVANQINQESFNQDFGASVGTLTAKKHPFVISANTIDSVPKGSNISLQYQLSSTDAIALGNPALAAGLGIYVKIPTGTALVSSSAASDLPTLYSTNDGMSWQQTEPADPAIVTDILWLLNEGITDQDNAIVSYQLHIPTGFAGNMIETSASVRIQGGGNLLTTSNIVPVAGGRDLIGKIFSDTGSPQHYANGQQDNGEDGIGGIKLGLYLDVDANGILDATDPKIREQTTDSNGKYDFRSLPEAQFILLLDTDSTLINDAWYGTTTAVASPVSLVSNSENNLRLGMSPLLGHEQVLLNPGPAYEGELLTYKVSLEHLMDQSNVYLSGAVWSETYNPAQLEFVSANPFPTTIDLVNGKLEWLTAATITAGETQEIELFFRPIATNYTQDYSVQLISTVENLQFTDKKYIEYLSDTLTQIIRPSGSISGYVWNDLSGSIAGWAGEQGFENGESFLPEIKLLAYGCVTSSGERLTPSTAAVNKACDAGANGGSWAVLDSAYTQADGRYLFRGLGEGFYYIAVDPSSLAINSTLKGDPDEAGVCVDCDAIWGDPSLKLQELNLVDASQDYTRTNFGYEVPAALTGYIWHDINGNGTKESIEIGIADFPVELISSDCSTGVDCPTSHTDADGQYSFENLTDNQTYTVSLGIHPLSSTYTFVQTAEEDGLKDGSIQKTIANAQWYANLNFGFQLQGPATLSVNLLADWNANRTQDAADEGINGVIVNLYFDADENGIFNATIDPFVKTMQSDANGIATFTNLIYGTYFHQLQIQDHSVLAQTQIIADPDEPASLCSICDGVAKTILSANQSSVAQTWAFQPLGDTEIEGLVWHDNNADQLTQSSIEEVIANINVELAVDLNQDGVYVPLTTVLSGVDGTFRFAELINSSYQVKVDAQDSDLPNSENGTAYAATNPIEVLATISDGSVNLNTQADTYLRFGFSQLASIGEIVFWDYNANGQRDEFEEGIAGVRVCLCEGEVNSCTTANALRSVVTSYGGVDEEKGSYLFEDLVPGTYTIGVQASTAPISNAAQSAHPASFGETCTSDCDSHHTLTIESGRQIQGINFGYKAKGVMGGVIWLDINNNKIMDEGEEGLANQTVALIPPSRVNIGAGQGRALIKTTNANGEYAYDNLPDGAYRLSAKAPAGYVLTNDGDGDVNGLAYIFIRSGEVIAYGRTYCSDCNMDGDIGLRVGGYYAISGNICLDDPSIDGLCDNASLDVSLGGLNVLLTGSDGTYLGSVTTQDDGSYSFPNLNQGTYSVSLPLVCFPLDIATLSTELSNSVASQINDDPLQSTLQVVLGTANLSNVDFAYDLEVDLDLGSLPSAYYERTGFAYHIIDPNNDLYLGQKVESQEISFSSLSGFIADNPGVANNSDDGISFLDLSAWEVGTVAESKGGSLQADVSSAGWLVGWVDFNQDLDFLDQGEMIINEATDAGIQIFDFSIPAGTSLDQTYYSRFRIFEAEPDIPPVSFSGGATAGEIEDYGIDFSSLPVELLSFEATLSDLGVDLEWVTASEQNTRLFDIERSVDGLLFNRVGTHTAVGTSSDVQIYEWADKDVINVGFPKLFYRLKMIDNDGSFVYSAIRSVVIGNSTSLSLLISPSPPEDVLRAEYTADPNNLTTLSIINGVGQTLWFEALRPQTGVNYWQHTVSDYPSGFYFLRLSTETEIRVIKFLKN
ncbi:MAG: SdrD B-like domain-containing protein [Bacteroidia bacterium]